eukprot:25682_1
MVDSFDVEMSDLKQSEEQPIFSQKHPNSRKSKAVSDSTIYHSPHPIPTNQEFIKNNANESIPAKIYCIAGYRIIWHLLLLYCVVGVTYSLFIDDTKECPCSQMAADLLSVKTLTSFAPTSQPTINIQMPNPNISKQVQLLSHNMDVLRENIGQMKLDAKIVGLNLTSAYNNLYNMTLTDQFTVKMLVAKIFNMSNLLSGLLEHISDIHQRLNNATETPTIFPSTGTSVQPTTLAPTHIPTINPTVTPSNIPSNTLTKDPSNAPTNIPTISPSELPTVDPSLKPTSYPSRAPTKIPTVSPSEPPTVDPSLKPTLYPSLFPSRIPTMYPSTTNPSNPPTTYPSVAPIITLPLNATFAHFACTQTVRMGVSNSQWVTTQIPLDLTIIARHLNLNAQQQGMKFSQEGIYKIGVSIMDHFNPNGFVVIFLENLNSSAIIGQSKVVEVGCGKGCGFWLYQFFATIQNIQDLYALQIAFYMTNWYDYVDLVAPLVPSWNTVGTSLDLIVELVQGLS